MIRELIINEFTKLSALPDLYNIPHNKKVKSFVFFNVSKEQELKIKDIVASEFSLIENSLKALRNKEIGEMLENENWVNEKYSDLIERYNGTSVQQEAFHWANEARKVEYERVLSTHTILKGITSNLHLICIDLVNFFEDIKQFDLLNRTLDFRNLYQYHHDEDFKNIYLRTEKERLYDELNDKLCAIYRAKYILCYNIDINNIDAFEDLFRSHFKWDYLYWSVFCLPMSQNEFENIASNFLKTELYYNRQLVDINTFTKSTVL